MWLKNYFVLKRFQQKQVKKEPLKNEDSIQIGSDKKLTKNKWLNPKDNFGKLKRGTE